jgi:hypothetical protein
LIFAWSLRSPFGLQAYTPSSSRSHYRFSLLVISPFHPWFASRSSSGCDKIIGNSRFTLRDEIRRLQRMRLVLVDGLRLLRPVVATERDIARQTRAGRLPQWTQCQRFLLPRLVRAARSKARREQIVGDAESPPGCRGEPESTAPSVPLPPAHSPWRRVHAKSDYCFSSFVCRTHASVELDVDFL